MGPAASQGEPPLQWHQGGSHSVFGDLVSKVTQPYPSPTRVLLVTQTDPGQVWEGLHPLGEGPEGPALPSPRPAERSPSALVRLREG